METTKQPIKLEPIQGHIILYCKGHYKVKTDQFFEGLKMIWAIRCGYDYELTDKHTLAYIANDMYKIIQQCSPSVCERLFDTIHRELVNYNCSKPKDMTPIESIIWEYRSILSQLSVREKIKNKWVWSIKLPKPKKQIFNRILRGNGVYTDYDKITKS